VNKILFLLIFSISAFAKDYKLSKDEFLERFDKGTLSLERAPVLAASPDLIERFIGSQKKEFPGFKEEMFYAGYVKSNAYTYILFYEWYNRGCIFGITEPKAFERASSDEARGSLAMEEYNNYLPIDKKYCEKLLGIKLDRVALTRIPNAIKPEKPKK